jgi:hypothetical protein
MEIEEETGIKAVFQGRIGIVSEHLKSENGALHPLLFICSLSAENYTYMESDEGGLGWFGLGSIDSHKGTIIPSDFQIIKQVLVEKKGFHFNSSINEVGGKYEITKFEKI